MRLTAILAHPEDADAADEHLTIIVFSEISQSRQKNRVDLGHESHSLLHCHIELL
jgi:hypothetical protein